MIQLRTILKVADNTGAKTLQCFHIKGGDRRRYASLGDIIVGTVKEAEPRKLVKKHEKVRAVIIRQKRSVGEMMVLIFALMIMPVLFLKEKRMIPKAAGYLVQWRKRLKERVLIRLQL